jgi:HEAT repeat protein
MWKSQPCFGACSFPFELGGGPKYRGLVARRKLEDVFAALAEARKDPSSAASLAELRQALGGKSPHAAAKAAKIAGESEVLAVVPEMLAAFDRFFEEPDPGCGAKAALADALYRIGHDDPAPFLRGIHHVQMEPVFGGRVDTAVDLRGACALGLARLSHREALLHLADLLADREPPARIAAARAIAYRGGEDGAPLLRLKALLGDEEPAVVSECLGALLRISPPSVGFVASFLRAKGPDVAEAAALALGESRLLAAFEALRDWSRDVAGTPRERTAFLALATLRREEALDHLLGVVREGGVRSAERAVEALSLYRGDEALRTRLDEAAHSRKERSLREAVEKAFG